MLPEIDKHQLTPYLREFNLVASSTRGSVQYSPWYGIYNNVASYGTNFAGLSMAPATDGTAEGPADTSAGDTAADAGFGGM